LRPDRQESLSDEARRARRGRRLSYAGRRSAVRPLAPLDNAWQQRLGTQWQVANDSPTAVPIVIDGNEPALLTALSELPGYVLYGNNDLRYQLFVPLADDRGGMSVKVPGNFGRDLYELRFPSANNATMLTLGSSIYVKV
jgi:hypothetical protein